MILPAGYEVQVSAGEIYRAGDDCPDAILKDHGLDTQVKAYWDKAKADAAADAQAKPKTPAADSVVK